MPESMRSIRMASILDRMSLDPPYFAASLTLHLAKAQTPSFEALCMEWFMTGLKPCSRGPGTEGGSVLWDTICDMRWKLLAYYCFSLETCTAYSSQCHLKYRWPTHAVSATWKAEARGLLVPRTSRSAWATHQDSEPNNQNSTRQDKEGLGVQHGPCLACKRSWVRSPVPQNKLIKY